MTDLTGKTVAPHQVLERLGRGGMADVYKALHPQLSVFRAIKFIRPELSEQIDFRERFQREAQAVASLRLPGIMQIHDPLPRSSTANSTRPRSVQGAVLKPTATKPGNRHAMVFDRNTVLTRRSNADEAACKAPLATIEPGKTSIAGERHEHACQFTNGN